MPAYCKRERFTGLNNLKVLSVSDVRFDEYFGFSDQEFQELLAYYKLSNAYDTIRDFVRKQLKENFYHGILLGLLACQEALTQMETNHYEDQLREDGICHILKYGIACFRK